MITQNQIIEKMRERKKEISEREAKINDKMCRTTCTCRIL